MLVENFYVSHQGFFSGGKILLEESHQNDLDYIWLSKLYMASRANYSQKVHGRHSQNKQYRMENFCALLGIPNLTIQFINQFP